MVNTYFMTYHLLTCLIHYFTLSFNASIIKAVTHTDSLLTDIAGTKNYSVEKSLSDALVGSATAVSKVEPIEGGFREDVMCCRSIVVEEVEGREGGEEASQVCSNV